MTGARRPGGASMGIALLDDVLATLTSDEALRRLRPWPLRDAPVHPLAPGAIASLELPRGRPLPPTLRRLLELDAHALGVIADAAHPVLPYVGFTEAVERCIEGTEAQLDEEEARDAGHPSPLPRARRRRPWARALARPMPGACLLVPTCGLQRHYLYLGEPDERGEYPVMSVAHKPGYDTWVRWPGLVEYVAQHLLSMPVEESSEAYRAAIALQRARNLHGARFVLDGQFFMDGGEDPADVGPREGDDIPF